MALDPEARFESVDQLGRALLPFGSKKGQTVWREFYGGRAELAVATTTPLRISSLALQAESDRRAVDPNPEPPQAATKLLTSSSQRRIALSPKSAPIVRDQEFEPLPDGPSSGQGRATVEGDWYRCRNRCRGRRCPSGSDDR
jgi:hypothetical protein